MSFPAPPAAIDPTAFAEGMNAFLPWMVDNFPETNGPLVGLADDQLFDRKARRMNSKNRSSSSERISDSDSFVSSILLI